MSELLWVALVWAMSSLTLTTGIGAGVVYAPALALLFGFDLPAAIATSVVVQVAGVGTTALGHLRNRNSDLAMALRLGVLGSVGVGASRAASSVIPSRGTEIAFVLGMSIVGVWLVAGRRFPLPHPNAATRAQVLRTRDGLTYSFCRPSHGYGLAVVAGAATGALGISGAEIQISALMLRCGVPAGVAVGTGTGAAAVSLATAVALSIAQVGWAFALYGIPSAVAGSLTARRLSHRVPHEGLRMAIGVLSLLSAVGVAIRAVNGG